jgi:6-phosphogluconolactonase (cycloisomerase 2 family)
MSCTHRNYSGASQITTHKLPLTGGQPLQSLKYTMNGPGANPNRQEAPHPHQVLVDPTGDFIIVPDLGADLIRINKIDKSTGKLTECGTTKQAPGTGPRHGVFWSPEGSTSRAGRAAAGSTLFIANELANSVSGWTVAYTNNCISLTLKNTLTPYANNAPAPSGTKVAAIKAKGKFLYTSNRNDKKFNGNDSMTQYTIAADGTLTFTEMTPSYGSYPRTFDINKAGDFVAIGDQTSANVAIVERDTKTGKLGKQVANLRIGAAGTPESENGLSAVVWAE